LKLLLDTQLLIWAAEDYDLVPTAAQGLMADVENELIFSTVSIWEVAIKRGLGRKSFRTRPQLLYRGLIDNGYTELAFKSEHAFALESLPPIHKDPFDRALVAQAVAEGITFLTTDRLLGEYPDAVRRV